MDFPFRASSLSSPPGLALRPSLHHIYLAQVPPSGWHRVRGSLAGSDER